MHLFDRDARVATAIALLLAVIGGIAVAAASNAAVAIIGAGLVAVAAVILIGVDFYLVGRSEDFDRLRHPHG